jgi:DNA helicase IV
MQFIKEYIKKKENEIIGQSNNAVKALDKDWNNFSKNDTYLIYDDKSNFLHLVTNGNKETKVPWYLFWDFKLKSNLKTNLEKLQDYLGKIEIYNQNFIMQKKTEYKDLFKKGDLILDNDQQTAIITDDKHNLIVAGAGSGKTEVLITRIAYLIKRKSDKIKPERILALAFQNKASEEIKERLKKRYGVDVEIRTFHSLGKKIIEDISKQKGNKAPKLKPECSEDWKYQRYIQTLFQKEISNNKKLQNDIINFMKKYEDEEVIKQKADFEKKKNFIIIKEI